MLEKYNFSEIESKWQKFWEDGKTFQTSEDEEKEKILRIGDVPIPIREITYGSCKKTIPSVM